MRNKILQKWRKNEIEIEYFKRQLQNKENFMMIEEEEKGNENMKKNDQNQQLKEEIDEKEDDDEIYDEIRLQITSNLTMGDLECSAADV